MILLHEKFDNTQHKINYDKQMLLDYQNKILKYDDYCFKNKYDKNKYKLLNRRKHIKYHNSPQDNLLIILFFVLWLFC